MARGGEDKPRLRRAITALVDDFDVRDAFLFGGIALLFIGLAIVSWALAFAVPGAIFVYIAIFQNKGE